MAQHADPAPYRCSTCGASPHQPCRTPEPGQPAPDGPHPARQARADRHAAVTARDDLDAAIAATL